MIRPETPLGKRLRATGEYLRRESERGIGEAEDFLGEIVRHHADQDWKHHRACIDKST